MNQRRLIPALFAVTLILGAWTTFHLDLVDSLPKEDQVLEEAPEVVWLEFSAAPDMSRSSFSIRGPEGGVELGEMEAGDEEEVIRARVVGEMPAGRAPIDDHTVRGRFDFTIESAQ
jgi:methionine-rich copper-binding protein CopC